VLSPVYTKQSLASSGLNTELYSPKYRLPYNSYRIFSVWNIYPTS